MSPASPTGSIQRRLHEGILKTCSPPLDDKQEAMLLSYLDSLRNWNQAYNLTAVRDPLQMIDRHILDSLAVLPWVGEGRLLDAGTGAGLPGIPLAVAIPRLDVTLLDSAGKKIRFLNHVLRSLGLGNAHTVEARLEDYQSAPPFDYIISRAFAELAAFVGAARHLVTPSTKLLAMKGRFPDRELQALAGDVRVDSVEALTVPGLQEDRHLVIMSISG